MTDLKIPETKIISQTRILPIQSNSAQAVVPKPIPATSTPNDKKIVISKLSATPSQITTTIHAQTKTVGQVPNKVVTLNQPSQIANTTPFAIPQTSILPKKSGCGCGTKIGSTVIPQAQLQQVQSPQILATQTQSRQISTIQPKIIPMSVARISNVSTGIRGGIGRALNTTKSTFSNISNISKSSNGPIVTPSSVVNTAAVVSTIKNSKPIIIPESTTAVSAPIAEQNEKFTPDNKHWGKPSWAFMHISAYYYDEKNPTDVEKDAKHRLFKAILENIPCLVCRNESLHYEEKNPIINSLSNRYTLSKWVLDLHNYVNSRLNELGSEPKKNIYKMSDMAKEFKLPTIPINV